MFCSFSSARRKEPKEASTYPKPFPIWKGVAENRRNRDFQSFGIARKACALKGERWRFYLGDTACVFFYRLRGELAGTRRLGKEKKGEKVASLTESSYLCNVEI
jgi:hypothetical protein